MYCSMRKEGDEIIECNSLSREIFNFVRALTYPGPCVISYINNKQIKILKTALIKNYPKYIGIPGSLLDLGPESLFVKTKDSYLEILEWDYYKPLQRGIRLTKGI